MDKMESQSGKTVQ